MLAAGDIVGDRYEVEGLAGRGGMAVVYRVKHRGLGSIHALKLLAMKQKGLSRRLKQEGEIQARLRHPNIVQVTDLVEHDGQVGLVMEFIDTPPLDDWLATNGPMDLDTALSLFLPVLSAVAAAHDMGILHRDIKPGNIMLSKGLGGFVPKVSDFGIAKMVLDEGPSRTVGGMPMGTPGYMAPEQIRDAKGVDARCDQFSLAAVLYAMLTGKAPYEREDAMDAMEATLAGSYPPLAGPGIPAHVVDAVARAMSTEKEDRFPTLREFGLALAAGRSELLGILAPQEQAGFRVARPSMGSLGAPRTPGTWPPTGATAVPGTQSGATLGSVPPARKAPLAVLILGVVGIVGALGAAGVVVAAATGLFLLPGDAPPAAEPTAAPAPVSAAPPPPQPAPVAAPAAPEPGDLAPGEPTAVVAPSPAPGSAPAPAPAPTAAPLPAPEPVVAEPEPAAPEPVVVAPAPEPVAPAPEPAAPTWPEVLGKDWVGKANGATFRLKFLTQKGERVSATATFLIGPTPKAYAMGGTLGEDGTLNLTSNEGSPVTINGRLAGGEFRGQYSLNNGKMLTWSASR